MPLHLLTRRVWRRRISSKQHVQLRNRTATALAKYIRAPGLWSSNSKRWIDEAISQCNCRATFLPCGHAKVGTRPPSRKPQAHISIYVIHLEGRNFIHTVDECTTGLEAGYICRKTMGVQIGVLRCIQYLRHGEPKTVLCDREYRNPRFRQFCQGAGTELLLVASNDHEAYGLIKNANRTIRSLFNRLRICDIRNSPDLSVPEALYGNNILMGWKQASAFELLYGRRPRLVEELHEQLPEPISIEEHTHQVVRRWVSKMLCSPVHKTDNISLGDIVAIYRNASGWLAPGQVTKVTQYYYDVIHNGHMKTSGVNRICLISSPSMESTEIRTNTKTTLLCSSSN